MTDGEPGVQGMRGLAALSVVGYHIATWGPFGPLAYLALGWGGTGVDLFLVVSGYILTKKMLDGDYHWHGRLDLGRYYLRRFFRIWPLYALSLPLYVALGGQVFHVGDLAFLQDYAFSTYLPSLLPTWTLCVEELFYATLPLWALLFVRWRTALITTVMLGAVSAGWTAWSATHYSGEYDVFFRYQFPTFGFSYAVGSMAARGWGLRLGGRWVGALTFVGFGVSEWVTKASFPQPLVSAVAFGAVLFNLRGSTLFANRWVVALGSLTYPLYLFSAPIEWGLMRAFADPWVWVPLTVVGSLAAAWALHRFVEKPLIGWGRKLERWV